jgi:hypothetical protein
MPRGSSFRFVIVVVVVVVFVAETLVKILLQP